MSVIGRQEGIVEVEFPDGGSVGPGGPLGTEMLSVLHAQDGGAVRAWMRQRLAAGVGDGTSVQRGGRYRSVVEETVDDHLLHFGIHRHGIDRHLGEFPGKLFLFGERLAGVVHPDAVADHDATITQNRKPKTVTQHGEVTWAFTSLLALRID